MKNVIWGACLAFVCSQSLASERIRHVANTQGESTVKIQQVMMIKECLSNRQASLCLSGQDIHVIQRILTSYVLTRGSLRAER